jgi:hypothetical protein
MTKVAEFTRIVYSCRECRKDTKIVYSKRVGDRTINVCEECNFKDEPKPAV